MTITVDTITINDGLRNHVVTLQGTSDGVVDEVAVEKVDISTLIGPDGINAPSYFAVRKIEWSIGGFTSVQLLFNATANDPLASLGPGQGHMDWADAFLNDPQSTGFNGDILLTTTGAAAGSVYTITLHLIKKQ